MFEWVLLDVRALSLFAGIGGLDYGLELAGIQTVLQVENDRWCRAVLEHHWPEVQRVDDVREIDASTQFRGGGDVAGAGRLADAERSRPARGRRSDTGAAGGGGVFRDALRSQWPRGTGADCQLAEGGGGPDWQGRCGTDGVDLIHGGFPCQDVSVAGRRAGLSGERSGLWFEFRRIVSELRPRWVVVENVPGLLSSHGGRDFGVVLRGLADLGYGWAYRVLDARWFGTPQRRRRVIVVGCLGDAQRAAQVLAVCESCGGDPASSGAPREDVAFTLAGGAPDTSRRIGNAWNTTYLPQAWSTKLANTQSNQAGKFYEEYTPALAENSPAPVVASTLSSGSHPESNLPGRHHEDDENLVVDTFEQSSLTGRGTFGYEVNATAAKPVKTQGDGQMIVASTIDEGMARPLVARASGYRMDLESENFLVASTFNGGEVDGAVPALVSGDGPHGRSPGYNGMDAVVSYPIRASDGHHGWSGPRGDGDDNLVVAEVEETVAISPRIARNSHTSNQFGVKEGGVSDSLEGQGGAPGVFSPSAGVRRLTPLECERLQGFPDGWTDIHGIADAHRYRMLGNAVDTVVAQWLGHRLVLVDSW